MNNWAGPKYMIAEGNTYTKYPEDEIYPHLIVNYVRLDSVPRFDDDWSPITEAMRRGDFFVATGEVLIPSFRVDGHEARKMLEAEVEWTFPLEFVEIARSYGATATPRGGRSCRLPSSERSEARRFAWTLMRPEGSGCASRLGTRPETARLLSPSTSTRLLSDDESHTIGIHVRPAPLHG